MGSRQFRVGQWNLRGLGRGEIQRLTYVLERESLDVLLACETWHTHEKSSLMQVPGYRVVSYSTRDAHEVLRGERGGGRMRRREG